MTKIRFVSVGVLVLAFCLFAVSNSFAQEETMTNAEVINLAKAGLNPTIIVNKIGTSKTDFDLSTDSLIELKKAGVTDAVVNAMLQAKSGGKMGMNAIAGNNTAAKGDPNDPMTPHGYGIYLYQEKNGEKKMSQLLPNVSAQNRTGGNVTAAITPFGLGKKKTKANLPGRNADLQIDDSTPVFYFYLDTSSGGLNTSSGIPSTPNEFALIVFNQRSDNREITVGKSNQWSSKGGLSDESVIPFEAEDMGSGIFKITPASALKKGEYAFFLLNSGNSNASTAIGSKFFDFGVMMTP